jgi:hypothetical protein
MIGDIQAFRMETIGEANLLSRLRDSLEHLWILSKDGPIKAAVEHLELSILDALEGDLQKGAEAAEKLEAHVRNGPVARDDCDPGT